MKPKKERFEWIRSWSDYAEEEDLPRVLLIGDSITAGYEKPVRELLRGVCYVDFVATSYAVDNPTYLALLDLMRQGADYRLFHLNHGLHGKHMAADVYEAGLRRVLDGMPSNSRTVLATTTVVRRKGSAELSEEWSGLVEERNAIVRKLAQEKGLPIDDLNPVSLSMPPEACAEDGVHYRAEGYEIFAATVAACIRDCLSKPE